MKIKKFLTYLFLSGALILPAIFSGSCGSPPLPPILISPPNGATGVSLIPLLKWNVVPTAISYRVQVSKDGGFTNIKLDSSGATVSQLQVKPGILDTNTKYFWRVNATRSGGAFGCDATGEVAGDWSDTLSFTTGKCLMASIDSIGSPFTCCSPDQCGLTISLNIDEMVPPTDWPLFKKFKISSSTTKFVPCDATGMPLTGWAVSYPSSNPTTVIFDYTAVGSIPKGVYPHKICVRKPTVEDSRVPGDLTFEIEYDNGKTCLISTLPFRCP